MIILATGVVTSPSCSPLYRSVETLLDAPTVDGLPHVDNFLRWVADEDLFVMGANAALELGPGGGNLMGAMRGARIVANELHGLMWKQPDGHKTSSAPSISANQYAALLGESSGNDSDGASSDDDDDGADGEPSTSMAAARPSSAHVSKKAATKQQKALAKARKHRRATKARRGMG